MKKVRSHLERTGKTAFINYFDKYKSSTDNNKLAKELLSDNTNASSMKAQLYKIRQAKWIFSHRKEKEALEIVANSRCVDKNIKTRAKEMLAQM